jgi:hypothetical protein
MAAVNERVAVDLLEYYRRAAYEAGMLYPRQAGPYFHFQSWARRTGRTGRKGRTPSTLVRSGWFTCSYLTHLYPSHLVLVSSRLPAPRCPLPAAIPAHR